MISEETQRLGALLTNENLAKVIEYAGENNISADTALNLIVLKWAEKDKIGGLKATDEAITLSQIEKRLKDLKISVNRIEATVNSFDPNLM